MNGIFSRTGLPGILERNDNRRLEGVLSCVAPFIDRRMQYEKTAPMKRVDTRYSEIVAAVTEDSDSEHGARNIWLP